ncbi:hypothetical protein [Streptomyces sp. enrichment culture]|uniref:hypothetical protein n=1 Tax=Streptomyces sp. enrichment culture TaxID=1795815 RepID=UPI003F558822
MRVRATAATAALLLAALTACGGGDDGGTEAKGRASATAPAVDCMDENISQADWMAHCSDEGAEPGGDSTGRQAAVLEFGESYTWPDGLEVTVVDAKVFTDHDEDLLESPEPGNTDFRVGLKLENGGTEPVALDDLSLIVEGATNGGEATFTLFSNGSQPLEGRLAPGVSTTKNHDNSIESEYGRKIVVTVQRNSDDSGLAFPEFNGTITD